MIIGVGTDLVEIPRLESVIHRRGSRLLNRLFTPDEQQYCEDKARPATHYAARFAAKEACVKALGTGLSRGIKWLEVEVCRDDEGKPSIVLTGLAREIAANLAVRDIHLSLTHTKDYASAVVVLEG